MAYVLLIVGVMLTIAGVRGKQGDLFTLVQGDFSGQNSFIFWLAAIALVGSVGYIEDFRGTSRAFLALILIVLFIRKGQGFFDQFTSALQGSTAPANLSAEAPRSVSR